MEAVEALREKAKALGEEVRAAKAAGGDFATPLEALKGAKQALSDAALALLPTQEQAIADLRAAGAAEADVQAAEEQLKALKADLIEDKKAKKQREKEEKRRKAEAEGKAAPADEAPKKDGPSKKELNRLKKKENKAAAKAKNRGEDGAAAAPDAKATKAAPAKPAAGGKAAVNAAPKAAPAAAPAAPASAAAGDVLFPLAASVVSVITGLNNVKGNVAELEVEGSAAPLRGDQTVARHLARTCPQSGLYGEQAENPSVAAAEIDQWLEIAQTRPATAPAMLAVLDAHLEHRTFLAGAQLSLADVGVWAALVRGLGEEPAASPALASYKHLARWVAMLKSVNGFAMTSGRYKKHIASSAASAGSKNNGKAGDAKGKPKSATEASKAAKDKFKLPPLKGGKEGQVVTRFPPEPSGHLHIGHFKALFLNKYYAERYQGRMLLRFDDTNPSNEKEEFEHGIIEDLKRLGIEPAAVSYTSDHFELIIKYAVKLIKEGNAYMDDSTQETMSTQRRAGEESVRRDEKPADSMACFMGMLFGEDAGKRCKAYGVELDEKQLKYVADNTKSLLEDWCLRAKIDQDTRNKHKGNKALFDPVIFRGNTTPHARTKTKYRAYPTYDLACPIVDSHEGVTHAMRDNQYRDRSPLYQWFFPKLGLRPVEIQDFSRLNFVYTLMSKRKLKWFVETNRVPGWDDPRFPTVKGILRRGMQLNALEDFMVAQGGSKNAVELEWDKFWNFNKKYIDPVAPRFMAVARDSSIPINVVGPDGKPFPESHKTVPLLPKDKDGSQFGFKSLFLGPKVLIEQEDVQGSEAVPRIKVGEKFVLLNWGVFECTKVHTNEKDEVTGLDATFEPEGDFKTPEKKIHWVTESPHNTQINMYEFDHLVSKAKLEENDKMEDVVRDPSVGVTELIGEPGIRNLPENSFLQLLRRGYMRVDLPYRPDKALDLFMIPDGKQKAMSTLSTKLAHR